MKKKQAEQLARVYLAAHLGMVTKGDPPSITTLAELLVQRHVLLTGQEAELQHAAAQVAELQRQVAILRGSSPREHDDDQEDALDAEWRYLAKMFNPIPEP